MGGIIGLKHNIYMPAIPRETPLNYQYRLKKWTGR
jgi:hypothetical protein